MSVSGFPDWQRITQWFAAPIDQQIGVSLDGGDHTAGPFDLLSFASVIVCVKAIGGPVTVTVKQSVPGGPASLVVASSFVVTAGNVVFEGIVLEAGTVAITFHEAGLGTSIDYAIVPSNVNTNVAGDLLTQLGFQHNDVPLANESAADFEDSASVVFSLADDAANARVKISASALLAVQHNDVAVASEGTLDFEDSATVTLTPADDAVNGRVKVTAAIPASVALPGAPTTTTAATADNSTKLATTAYVQAQAYVTALTAPVRSVFGRGGAVAAVAGDYTAAMVTNAADKASSSTQAFVGSLSTQGQVIGAEQVALTQAAAITPNFASGNFYYGEWTGGATMTIANPTNVPGAGFGGILGILIRNQRGASITAISYGTAYRGGPPSITIANNSYIGLWFWYSSRLGGLVFVAGGGGVGGVFT